MKVCKREFAAVDMYMFVCQNFHIHWNVNGNANQTLGIDAWII